MLQCFTRQRPAGKLLGRGHLTLSPSKVVSKPSFGHRSVSFMYHASNFVCRGGRLFRVVFFAVVGFVFFVVVGKRVGFGKTTRRRRGTTSRKNHVSPH